MSDQLLCTYCGTYNDAHAERCVRCGHELERIIVPRMEAEVEQEKAEEEDLLRILMEEPVTEIPKDPAPAPRTRDEQAYTQVFTRTELNAAIAAQKSEERAREDKLSQQKERLIEESLRYLEQEKRDREEMRLEKLRRQQEEELYSEFKEQPEKAAAPPPAKKKRGWIPVVAVLALLLIVGGVLGYKYLFAGTNVDLTRNIAAQDIQLQGKDGEASVIIDEELFRSRADYPRGNEKAETFMKTVSYTIEPAAGLSNGDKITVRAIYSQETANELHINVKGKEKTFEINGLEEKSSINWDPLGLFTDDDAESQQSAGEVTEVPDGDTLIPEFDSRYYTSSDVAGKDAAQIQAMVNELYARHGYIFKDQSLQQAYEQKSWYKGTTTDTGEVEMSFNDYERANLTFLTDHTGQ